MEKETRRHSERRDRRGTPVLHEGTDEQRIIESHAGPSEGRRPGIAVATAVRPWM